MTGPFTEVCLDPGPETFRCRIRGLATRPTLIYLPGIHGDWTLVGPVRHALQNAVRWVEFTYPRTPGLTLEDYSRGVTGTLLRAGITSGWILAESFGSQVAWPVAAEIDPGFRTCGLILAGGFGTYPSRPLLQAARAIARHIPCRSLRTPLNAYARLARWRRRTIPELQGDIDEFLARRTQEDWEALLERMRLIAGNRPEALASRCTVPAYYLTGLFDPVVPWPTLPGWLRRHCPAFAGWKLVPHADHSVLVTAPKTSALCIRQWMALPDDQGLPRRPPRTTR